MIFICYLHQNNKIAWEFFFYLNARDNLNNVFFFDPQSKSKPYPTDNRDEMN